MSTTDNHYVTREEYRSLLDMAQRGQRPRGGCLVQFVNVIAWLLVLTSAVFVALTIAPDVLVSYGVVSPETMNQVLHLATPQAVNRLGTPLPEVRQPPPPPPPAQVQVWPQNGPIATEQEEQQSAEPTATPAPGITGTFWTEEELAAFRATEEAWYDPNTLPTVEPAFRAAVEEGCEDAAKRAQSPLLNSWCAPLDE